IHVLGGEVTRAIVVQIPAMQPVGALWTGVALGASGTGVTLGTQCTGIPLGTLSARLTGFALRPDGTGRAVVAAITLGAAGAVHAAAILYRPGAIEIHVLGGEVTRAILVQIPAMRAVRAF